LELAENKQLLKHLTDSQVKRGSRSRARSNTSDAPVTEERCRDLARKWNEEICSWTEPGRFLQNLAGGSSHPTAGNRKALILLNNQSWYRTPDGMGIA